MRVNPWRAARVSQVKEDEVVKHNDGEGQEKPKQRESNAQR